MAWVVATGSQKWPNGSKHRELSRINKHLDFLPPFKVGTPCRDGARLPPEADKKINAVSIKRLQNLPLPTIHRE
jgi:hypothetical protein